MKISKIGKTFAGVAKSVGQSVGSKSSRMEHKTPYGTIYQFDETKNYEDMSIDEKIAFSNYFKDIDDYNHTYQCPKCGGDMEFEDDMEDVLICEDCGYDIAYEQYGYDKEVFDYLNDDSRYLTQAEFIFQEKIKNGELEEDDYEALSEIKFEYGEWDELYDDWRE